MTLGMSGISSASDGAAGTLRAAAVTAGDDEAAAEGDRVLERSHAARAKRRSAALERATIGTTNIALRLGRATEVGAERTGRLFGV
jgi:hypothetical protein